MKQKDKRGVTMMTLLHYLLILAGGLALVLLLTLSPQPFLSALARVSGNLAMGLALLLLVNAVSEATGLLLPLNWCTLACAALMGAPGITACAALAAV